MTASPEDIPTGAPAPWHRRAWRGLKAALVAAFVCWHLLFLAVRNPLDLWWKPFTGWRDRQAWWGSVQRPFDWVDNGTWYYGNFLGIEQGWCMFSPPIARRVTFLGARLHMNDGTEELVRSENEPDPLSYFRVGGWRQRKLEDILVNVSSAELAESLDLPLFGAYVRWSIRRWEQAHPGDPRCVTRVSLVRRRIQLPGPADDPRTFPAPDEETIAGFTPQGELQ